MLTQLHFPPHFTSLIMNCIKSISFQTLVNSFPSKSFKPQRRRRQGDLLSPFLSVICVERLSELIKRAITESSIQGIKIWNGGLEISHLFFVDDGLLFVRVKDESANTIKQVLQIYVEASRQLINYQKSLVLFEKPLMKEISRPTLSCREIQETYFPICKR